ncbi:hypothetical protein [Streptomyces sp. NBC_00338]|uniref:hypothetical protein n=1 Tax=Streptomyces sp. NBC_00338 TaxID=2975715 RepID=UPI00225346EE|nr:hypothetical protein [Streptomyces sp. NBC_00338]MCX5138374.1 hypothetical protein [Streptomyces sp. NBC_00338]MCX5145163.1 hypothetical protein [Streptomyces sp. NBC_00338]
MSTPVTERLLASALANARAQLAAAEDLDINDDLAVITSQAGLAAALRRVLWVLNAEDDDLVDVADQVAAEDGVRRIGIPTQRNGSVAA